MSRIGNARELERFPDPPADKNPNKWEKGKVDKADAKEILEDTRLKKTELKKGGGIGDTVYSGEIRITSRDGTSHWLEVNAYDMDLEDTCRMIQTIRALAVQIPDHHIGNWFEGARFQKATLPGGQTNMIGLHRYDPGKKEYMAVSSKDRWGIQPTISKIEPGKFWYFTFHFDELVEGGKYNKGSAGGPWDKWSIWAGAEPKWECHYSKSRIDEPDRDDYSWAGWARWLGRNALTSIDWTLNSVQRLGKVVWELLKKVPDAFEGKSFWGGVVVSLRGIVVVLSFLVKETVTKVGQVALWGVLKVVGPLVNVANYYTRGNAKGYMSKIAEMVGIYLYTHEHHLKKTEEVFKRLFKEDKKGDLGKDETAQTSYATTLDFEEE